VSFLPPSQTVRRLTDSLQHELSLYGYQLIETPVIDSADLFLTRAGDQLITRLFTFERSGQQLALRPEFTAAAAHHYALFDTQKIARWQFNGIIFEDDPASNHFQRMSMGAELIGMDGPAADAEIISLAASGIAKQNLQNWRLFIGHTGLVRHLLALFGLDRRTERFLLNHLATLKDLALGKDAVLAEFDRTLMGVAIPQVAQDDAQSPDEISTQQMLNVLLDATQRGMTMGSRTQHDIARRLLNKHQRFTERQQVVEALDLLEQWVAISAPADEAFVSIEKLLPASDRTGQALLKSWREAVELLASYAIHSNQIVIQPHVARNWDYYTGIVFEIATDEGVRLAGGGRYDELVSLVGGQPVPAVGFAYYLDQMLEYLAHEPASELQPFVILVNSANQRAASQLAFALRSRDISVVLSNEAEPNGRTLTIDPYGSISTHSNIYAEVNALIAAILAGNV
jgi:histidyl-tRNA synthetase